MSLQRRRERYQVICVFKMLNGLMPNDIGLTFSDQGRRGIRATVPSLKKGATTKAQRMYDDSFAVVGPRLWNCIPAETTRKTKLSTFKSSLGRYLKTIPDMPPDTGIHIPQQQQHHIICCKRSTFGETTLRSPPSLDSSIQVSIH